MQLILKVLSGQREGQKLKIPQPKCFVGRAPDCQLRPDTDQISRHHCVISQFDDAALIRDLGSKNGTFVNGERITRERELNDGDLLEIGPFSFQVIVVASEVAAAAPASTLNVPTATITAAAAPAAPPPVAVPPVALPPASPVPAAVDMSAPVLAALPPVPPPSAPASREDMEDLLDLIETGKPSKKQDNDTVAMSGDTIDLKEPKKPAAPPGPMSMSEAAKMMKKSRGRPH
jgi:predicted component of type VI protein secretion system